tara:strand:- start:1591 stop:1917 length:327 start_codon:yes stop_codon:yes gene_type:complete
MPRQRNNSDVPPAPDSPSAVPRRQELLNLAGRVATLTQNFQDSMFEVNRKLDSMQSDIDYHTVRLDELDAGDSPPPSLAINAGKISAKTRRKSKKPVKRKHKKSKRKT